MSYSIWSLTASLVILSFLGDWLAVPFGDPLLDQLSTRFGVRGIPALKVNLGTSLGGNKSYIFLSSHFNFHTARYRH